MQIKIDTSKAIAELRRAFDALSEDQVDKASSRAINRTLAKGKTHAGRSIRELYAVKLVGINRAIELEKSSPSKLEGAIVATRKPIPLKEFGSPRQTRRGVSLSIYKGSRVEIAKAFMPKGSKAIRARGNYEGESFKFRTKRIYKRGYDYPIPQLVSASIGSGLKHERTLSSLSPMLQSYFRERLEHELRFLASKLDK